MKWLAARALPRVIRRTFSLSVCCASPNERDSLFTPAAENSNRADGSRRTRKKEEHKALGRWIWPANINHRAGIIAAAAVAASFIGRLTMGGYIGRL